MNSSSFERLRNLCYEHGFSSRGRCFFKQHTPTIMQAITVKHERVFSHYSLKIGLMSMYSLADSSSFTAQSNIPDFCVSCLDNCATAVTVSIDDEEELHISIRSLDDQIHLLNEKGFDWLDSIQSQEQLINAYNYLEMVAYKDIIRNNERRLAPFLAIGDYCSADYVIASILNQHMGPNSIKSPPWEEKDFLYYAAQYPGEDEDLLHLHRLIADKNEEMIKAYLEGNYQQNVMKTRFKKRRNNA